MSLAINYTLESPSPDGRFALRLDPLGVEDDSAMSAAIVERGQEGALAELPATRLGNYSDCRLVWSADSQRVAYTGGGKRESRTQVFYWNGQKFLEIKLPVLPKPDFKASALGHGPAGGLYSDFISPVRWLESGALQLSRVMTMRRESNTFEGKLLIEIAITKEHRAKIERVERSKIEVELF